MQDFCLDKLLITKFYMEVVRMRMLLKLKRHFIKLFMKCLTDIVVIIFSHARHYLIYVSGLSIIISVILFIKEITIGGVVMAIIAYLISPIGIPAFAMRLIVKLYKITATLIEHVVD